MVIQDLLELVHWLTRLKVAPDGAGDAALAEAERTKGVAMARELTMPVLTRAWQMLLKGLSEVRVAPMPLQAAEMVLVRLAYAAELPPPADAIKALEGKGAGAVRAPAPAPAPSRGPAATYGNQSAAVQTQPQAVAAPSPMPAATALAVPQSFAEIVALFDAKREAVVATHLKRNVRLVRFETGLIEFNPERSAPKDLAGQVGKLLTAWTGQRWVVSVVGTTGEPTLHEQELTAAKADPLVQSILTAFPGATIEAVRPKAPKP
jgi:DNA polymerase-3 subunit gamma/tau